jgi:two-component system KDP operon response regulator KdpE
MRPTRKSPDETTATRFRDAPAPPGGWSLPLKPRPKVLIIGDKVRALDAGANDYVAKPFAPAELAARLRVLQRCEPPTDGGPLVVSGTLQIDLATRAATVSGHPLKLTATEEAVLFILARHAGKLVPQQHLTRVIWGTDAADKIVELRVYIARLRRKLEEHGGNNLIRGEGTVGYGLAFAPDQECAALKT